MAFTLSGVWTGVIISLLALSILYIVTNIKGIFLLVYPGVMIWILLLSMLRMFFSAEFAFAQGIFLKNIFPPLDFLLRFPLLKGIRIYHILITFWGVGALRKIQSLVLDYSSMYKLLLACPGLEKEQLCIAKNAEKDTGISRHNIQYKTSAQYDVPLLFGIFRSTILIPEKYRSLSNEELYFVFGHELSHQKKHDCIMRLGIHIICCIFWWIPFLDKLVSHIEEAMEIRADWNMTKNMSVSQKKSTFQCFIKRQNGNALKRLQQQPACL